MLVLTRVKGESVLLDGGRIRIMVVAVRANGQIRLGFDLDSSVDVVREEIADDWLKHRRGPSPYGPSPMEGAPVETGVEPDGPTVTRGRRSPGRRAR